MDIDVAYAQLSKAMDELRRLAEGCRLEGLPDAENAIEDAVNAWEGVDQWMRKSGFPPVAWNNPATPKLVIPVTPTGEVIGPRDAVLSAEQRQRHLAAQAAKDAVLDEPLTTHYEGDPTPPCTLGLWHEGGCER